MTLWARPNPGPCVSLGRWAAAVRALNWRMSARLMPRMAEPPTRSNSRRVTPSQVSFPARPGITNIAGVPWLVVESEAWRVGVGGSLETISPVAGQRQSISPDVGRQMGVPPEIGSGAFLPSPRRGEGLEVRGGPL